VTFVSGPGGLHPGLLKPDWESRLFIQEVVTFDDLMKVMSQELGGQRYQVVFHAMAVLDYVPERCSAEKTPSGLDQWTLHLVPTPKIIHMIKRWDPRIFLVGFKLEVGAGQEELIQSARRLAERSQSDLVVANELGAIQRGEHWALVIDARGQLQGTFRGKAQIARGLLNLVENKLKGDR
jgi:phosphopantothenoylcysteine synthetase/decarboxylase